MYQALLLIGVGGVGKSTVADATRRLLTAAGAATAVVDTDMLAQFGPPPNSDDPQRIGFYDRLKCVNLAAVWANFKAVGARFIVVAAGIEDFTVANERPADMVASEIIDRAGLEKVALTPLSLTVHISAVQRLLPLVALRLHGDRLYAKGSARLPGSGCSRGRVPALKVITCR